MKHCGLRYATMLLYAIRRLWCWDISRWPLPALTIQTIHLQYSLISLISRFVQQFRKLDFHAIDDLQATPIIAMESNWTFTLQQHTLLLRNSLIWTKSFEVLHAAQRLYSRPIDKPRVSRQSRGALLYRRRTPSRRHHVRGTSTIGSPRHHSPVACREKERWRTLTAALTSYTMDTT